MTSQARSLHLVREIEQSLSTIAVDGPPVLPTLLAPLRELLQLDKAVIYGVAESPEGPSISFGHISGARIPTERFANEFRAALRGTPRWGFFDPRRPERRQRNRAVVMPPAQSYDAVLSRTARSRLGIETSRALDIVRAGVGPTAQFMGRIGLDGDHQLRMLVCDESGILAWVGGYRREPFARRERTLLQSLVRPLQRRLALERRLQDAPLVAAALDASLEALARAAFVVGAEGRIHFANALGRAAIDRDPAAMRHALVDAVRGREVAGLSVTPLRLAGACAFLVVGTGRPDPEARMAQMCRRWSLTPRQAQVLQALCRGATNREIGAQLGASERTVEVHMTALMQKAGVESRAALVAAFWRES